MELSLADQKWAMAWRQPGRGAAMVPGGGWRYRDSRLCSHVPPPPSSSAAAGGHTQSVRARWLELAGCITEARRSVSEPSRACKQRRCRCCGNGVRPAATPAPPFIHQRARLGELGDGGGRAPRPIAAERRSRPARLAAIGPGRAGSTWYVDMPRGRTGKSCCSRRIPVRFNPDQTRTRHLPTASRVVQQRGRYLPGACRAAGGRSWQGRRPVSGSYPAFPGIDLDRTK